MILTLLAFELNYQIPLHEVKEIQFNIFKYLVKLEFLGLYFYKWLKMKNQKNNHHTNFSFNENRIEKKW